MTSICFYLGGEAGAIEEDWLAPEVPPPPALVSTISGFSGCKLSISFSTGMDLLGGVTGTGPVTFCPGVLISLPVFGSRNGIGYFSSGIAWPAGMGLTI